MGKKSALLVDIDSLRNELLMLEQSLSLWQNDASPIQLQLQQMNDLQDLTVKQMQVVYDGARKAASDGKERRLQARKLLFGRILDTANKIAEISNGDKVQIGGQELQQISETSLQEMPGKRLQEFEKEILARFNQLVIKVKTGDFKN